MDYGRLFSQSWHSLRQQPALLMFGLMATAGTEAAATYTAQQLGAETTLDVAKIEAAVSRNFENVLGNIGLLLAALLFIAAIWLVTTIAEGGLILAVGRATNGDPPPLTAALRGGLNLLWRFILIDTVIFFPLFIVLFTALIVLSVAIFNLVLGFAEYDAAAIEQTALIGGGCLLLLGCIVLPVGVVSFIGRALAFRAAALNGLETRASLRQMWHLIRSRTAAVLLIWFVLWLLRLIARLLLRQPLLYLSAALGSAATGVGLLINLALGAALFTFSSAVWTHAYPQLTLDT